MLRDLIVSLSIMALMPVSFRRPYIGLVMFSWLAYMRVQDLTWGFAKSFRWSFYIAIIMFVGFALKKKDRFFKPDIRNYMMMGMVVMVALGVAFGPPGADPTFQVKRLIEFAKIVGIALFTTGVVRTREHMRLLIWVIALSFGFYGVKNGIWGIMTLGRTPIKQGPGGLMFDNNDFSLALCMAIPMLWMIGESEKRQVLSRAFKAMVPLTAFTVLLTQSRGGLLSLVGCIGVLVWHSKHRVKAIIAGLVLAVVGFAMMPDGMRDRFMSIRNFRTEGSAQSRFRSWSVAIRMATANPLLGVGLSNFRGSYLKYQPNPTAREMAGQDIYVAHNSYLQIWAETGTISLLLYLGLIVLSFVTIWRVRAKARLRYESSWIINYATMFEASLVAFVIGSTFLNRAHFDLVYHWFAVIMLFGEFAEQQMKEDARNPLQVGSKKGRRGTIRALGGQGFGVKPRPPSGGGFRDTPLVEGSR
ncbi:putative O-glycosylation ligase, exosortase A system-associated [Engelhardtia mirabilis]|uniref:O-Antigen ligase n=1 Tax=Engelhardtia mirabilis TaxID=2528011 RepID=A0A518BKD5_9BACT|nr:O-Antigen ligase [Planctomycetes bacterium Pla133]QDV01754.1 O-Antigen ligase [Planctomycetes bacterium Pla86]